MKLMFLAFDSMSLITPDFGLVFWTTLVFLVFWFIVGKKAIKPIVKAIEDRNRTIQDALNSAEQAKAEIQQMHTDNESQLKQAREEGARILKEARDMKDAMLSDATNKAKEETAKIIADARIQIEAQKTSAIAELKTEVGKLSIDIAEKVLSRELDSSKSHQEYVKSLVDKMSVN
jgi:F-type H+-transporting ATPase subunit b